MIARLVGKTSSCIPNSLYQVAGGHRRAWVSCRKSDHLNVSWQEQLDCRSATLAAEAARQASQLNLILSFFNSNTSSNAAGITFTQSVLPCFPSGKGSYTKASFQLLQSKCNLQRNRGQPCNTSKFNTPHGGTTRNCAWTELKLMSFASTLTLAEASSQTSPWICRILGEYGMMKHICVAEPLQPTGLLWGFGCHLHSHSALAPGASFMGRPSRLSLTLTLCPRSGRNLLCNYSIDVCFRF